MPWQRYVADVATEVMPDGAWAYGVVKIGVQRQAGKTTMFGPVVDHRCLLRPAGKAWITAQTGADARDIWLEAIAQVRRSPLSGLVKVREANGSESLTWPSGSTFRPFPPSEDSLHGKANEIVGVDEAWAFDDAQGTALEAAILPTFSTTGGQLWIFSAGGTPRSEWWLRHVMAGRLAVECGLTEGVCYFEWGVTEDAAAEVAAGLDPELAGSPAFDHAIDLIMAAHPAAGHTLRRGAVITSAGAMKPGEFLRAFGNHWTRSGERVIPESLWNAGRKDPRDVTAWPAPVAGVALGFAASVDHRDAAIVAAWRDDPAGPIRLDVVEHRPGTDWLPERILEVRAAWRAVAVGHDKAGPALDVADELARALDDEGRPLGVELVATTTSEYAAACASLLRHVVAGRLEHAGQAALDDAVAATARRTIGDGLWAWARRSSSASIAALEAATEAAWAWDHRPAPARSPVVVAGRRPGVTATRRRRRISP